MKQVLGIDLGGTAIKLGKFTQYGTCVATSTIATPIPATPEAVMMAMVTAIDELDSDRQCIAIGVGTPGPVDETARIAQVAINLQGWQNVPLADWLEAKTGLSTIIANDANCAGVGEAWLGAGKRFQHMILLTLGTGVGGAIVLNGHLYTGRHGAAGELGLITINFDGPFCNSGNNGSLEQYASIQGIRRLTGREPLDLAIAARKGEEQAITFWQEYGKLLGAGLASLIYVLTPEAVIIGGGISAGADLFFPATMEEIQRRVLPSSRQGLELLTAELGNQAGMVGAAKLAWEFIEKGM